MPHCGGEQPCALLQPLTALPARGDVIVVHAGDHADLDLLGTYGFAFADVGAASEAFDVVLHHHAEGTAIALRLALRQNAEMRDLRGGEQGRGCIGASRYAGAAADASGRVHGAVGCFLGHQDRVAVRRRARRTRDVAAGGDDPVEGAAVHYQVLDDRERPRAPGLEVHLLAVLEMPQRQLADRCSRQRAVRDAVDHEPARPADSFAAVVFERHGLFVFFDELFVEHVERFQHRHVRIQISGFIANHAPALGRALLAPDMQDELHYLYLLALACTYSNVKCSLSSSGGTPLPRWKQTARYEHSPSCRGAT